MKKPNLFIVGAAKAGTTSIYKYLSEHPDIYMSPIKEPNFFGSDISWEDFRHDYKINTQLDFDKYFSKKKLIHKHIAFIEDINLYMKLFRNGEDFKILGEASTSYLYSKLAAKEIYKFNPTAKIIIILRDPLERTISHYLMDYSSKKYKTKNILEDLKKDFYSSKKGYGITNLYIDLSLYSEQILRYIKIFPKCHMSDACMFKFVNQIIKEVSKLHSPHIRVFFQKVKKFFNTFNVGYQIAGYLHVLSKGISSF